LNFLNGFSERIQISNFIKFRPVRAEFLHVEGQTGMTKLTVVFRSFENAQ